MPASQQTGARSWLHASERGTNEVGIALTFETIGEITRSDTTLCRGRGSPQMRHHYNEGAYTGGTDHPERGGLRYPSLYLCSLVPGSLLIRIGRRHAWTAIVPRGDFHAGLETLLNELFRVNGPRPSHRQR